MKWVKVSVVLNELKFQTFMILTARGKQTLNSLEGGVNHYGLVLI